MAAASEGKRGGIPGLVYRSIHGINRLVGQAWTALAGLQALPPERLLASKSVYRQLRRWLAN